MNVKGIAHQLLLEEASLEQQIEWVRALEVCKGDADLLVELVEFLLTQATMLSVDASGAVDIVGTGGDGFNTLNFSTMSAFVVHAAGVPVLKQGNKSVTSKCGSFDVLARMDVPVPEKVAQAEALFAEKGGVFLFAPYFHPILVRVREVRTYFARQGQKTIFNILGPLLNPARVKRMVAGVYDSGLIPVYAEALKKLGVEYAYVFHGSGLDELTLAGPTQYAQLARGAISYGELCPDDLGLSSCSVSDLEGGDPDYNYERMQSILSGRESSPAANMVIANSAAALRVASGFELSWLQAVTKARQTLGGGCAHTLS